MKFQEEKVQDKWNDRKTKESGIEKYPYVHCPVSSCPGRIPWIYFDIFCIFYWRKNRQFFFFRKNILSSFKFVVGIWCKICYSFGGCWLLVRRPSLLVEMGSTPDVVNRYRDMMLQVPLEFQIFHSTMVSLIYALAKSNYQGRPPSGLMGLRLIFWNRKTHLAIHFLKRLQRICKDFCL